MVTTVAPTPDETTRYVATESGRPTKDFYNWLKTLRNVVASSVGTALLKANNLSDVASAATSRTNLGLDNYVNYPAKPSFSVVNSTTQVVSTGYTQLAFNTELYDVGSFFTSNTWTPPAGKVSMQGAFIADSTTLNSYNLCGCAIYKNGVVRKQFLAVSLGTTLAMGGIAMEDVCNGSDVYAFFIFVSLASGTATVRSQNDGTWWSGHWICP